MRDNNLRFGYCPGKRLLFVLISAVLISCGGEVQRKQLFFKMDTVTEVTVSVRRSLDIRPVWRSMDSLLSTYEKRFSVTGGSSEISAINGRASPAVPISPELGDMLRAGLAYGDTLGGSFDITVLPLKELWGLCEQCTGEEPLPSPAQIAAAAGRVDYRRLRLDGDTVICESPDISIDVGGIAKGYAIARLQSLLADRGIANYLISAGGDIAASGRKRGGAPWVVGVRHPRSRDSLLAKIPLESGAVVTSGDYERFRIVDSVRFHHIFNPATGRPCNGNQSLTIRAAGPARADILSTGLFCRSAPEILEFVQKRDDLECLIVDSAGKIHSSDDKFWF
ncbi:MAG: FAD:protein FMN transferase [Chitinispirillia bacterium]|nr:FAD:protein FMN transferase [Chitinispirillia bacterium]MCL2242727.1 FAD:protein FMN transferase [Chitinispirillia bacterium]